jgi:PAS domain S-box-containing protein
MSLRPSETAALIAESERFHLLIEAVTDYAIYMVDTDGVVVTWNPGAQRLKGYTPAEIIGQPYSRFFSAEDRARGVPQHVLAQARIHGRYESESWRIRKDGTRFLALAVIQAVRDGAGRLIGFAKITRDITERQAAQDALRDSERRFRMLVDGLTDYAIYMLDPSGVITKWNAGAARIKGYSAEEIIGRHFSRFYTVDDRRAGLPARVLEVAAREGRYEMEGWRVRKDGSRFWAAVVIDAVHGENGELLGFAKITRDMTERRAAQEALRDSERQFRLLVSGVSDYAIYMLDPNGIVSSWNTGAARIKGYSADEIIGQHFSKFYTEGERSAGRPARALQQALEQGRSESEGWRVRKDGSLFWANVVIDPIRDENGVLVGFAKITRDMTERRAAQRALQETQAQLAQSQKLEALGQLTGGVAHDFNNLLMIVSGHIRIVRKALGPDAKALGSVEAVELAARRGEGLTRQLLTFSRRQTLSPVVLRLKDAIDSIRTLLASSIGEAARFATALPPDLWPVAVDANELELAIVNLALNARDALPEGGVIALSAENVELAPSDTPARLAGEFVALTVADTGCGIPEDILPRVFDPFFTTKRTGKGTGLGLSQAHGFAHQSGGTITIHSEVGAGTRVTIYLPRATAAVAPAPPQAAPGTIARGGTVLLVEDNPEVARVTAAMLEELGLVVSTAGDADAALQALAAAPVDLVISDIVMAGAMNGVRLARAIRERYPTLPVALATGYSAAAQEAAGEFVVLRKPYQLPELGRAVARLMAQADAPPANLVALRDARRARGKKPDSPSD